MKFVLCGLLLIAAALFAAPTYADSPQQPSVQCVSPAPVPELAIGYGGNWGILNAINDLSGVIPGFQVSTYTDTAEPLGVYVVNPESEDVNVLVYYKDLQRDVDIKGRPLYYRPPVEADQWISICYLHEIAQPEAGQRTQGVIVPSGSKLLIPVVISIPGNATLEQPTYLALEFAEVSSATIQAKQVALFLILPAPPSSNSVMFIAFAAGLCVVVVAVYLFTLRRRRVR